MLNSAIPMGRMAPLDEIAKFLGFWATNAFSYITDTSIFADGCILQRSPGIESNSLQE